MKKTVVTFFAFVLILSSVSLAQFKIGPKFGLNISSISDEPDYDPGVEQSSQLNIMFGATGELGIAGPFCVELELLYVQKGEDLSGYYNNLPAEQTQTATYLAIPILAKVKLPLEVISPYAYLGPDIGLLLSANRELTIQGQSQGEVDIKDELSSIDFALDFGGGVGFNIAPLITLTFDARFSLGLSNIIDTSQQQQQQQTEPSAKTRGIQLMLGAMFGL